MEAGELEPGVLVDYEGGRPGTRPATRLEAPYRLRSGTVIYRGSRIGPHLETGHNVVIREDNEIGEHLSIWSNSVVDYGCRIGDRVRIHTGCYIAQGTVIEDDVFLAPGVMLANDRFPITGDLVGPVLEAGCRLGVNVTVLPGVRIGRRALVGAGSVVTKDVPPETVVYGNPAREQGSIFDLRRPDGGPAYSPD